LSYRPGFRGFASHDQLRALPRQLMNNWAGISRRGNLADEVTLLDRGYLDAG
jgi:hypothetical protein